MRPANINLSSNTVLQIRIILYLDRLVRKMQQRYMVNRVHLDLKLTDKQSVKNIKPDDINLTNLS